MATTYMLVLLLGAMALIAPSFAFADKGEMPYRDAEASTTTQISDVQPSRKFGPSNTPTSIQSLPQPSLGGPDEPEALEESRVENSGLAEAAEEQHHHSHHHHHKNEPKLQAPLTAPVPSPDAAEDLLEEVVEELHKNKSKPKPHHHAPTPSPNAEDHFNGYIEDVQKHKK